jgi:hypothetical protein
MVESEIVEDAVEPKSTLARGQFSRPALLFKARAPKFSPGKIDNLPFSIHYVYK